MTFESLTKHLGYCQFGVRETKECLHRQAGQSPRTVVLVGKCEKDDSLVENIPSAVKQIASGGCRVVHLW